MEEYFYLKENSLSGAVPTEIGALAKMKEYLYFYSNELCDDVPTEVAALSSQFTTGFNLATGNSFGTPCFLLTDQYTALSALYDSAGGGGWRNQSNWMDGEAGPCTGSWYGVTCDSAGEVEGLHAVGNGLSGTLPTELGDLTSMKSGHDTDFAGLFSLNSDLTGTLPSGTCVLNSLCHGLHKWPNTSLIFIRSAFAIPPQNLDVGLASQRNCTFKTLP